MKLNPISWGLMVALVGGAMSSAVAQEKKKAEQPDQKQIQKMFEEFAKPGKEHKNFKRLVGRWSCAVTSYYPDPSKPQKTKGNAVFRLLLGGRYMQQNFRGMMDGKRFQGIGVSGFDNAKKKYVGTWIDNSSTSIMHSEGTYDPKTQTMTEVGTSSSPIGPMKMKMVTKYESNDKFHFTMYMLAGQGEQKIMEIDYSRIRTPKRADAPKTKK